MRKDSRCFLPAIFAAVLGFTILATFILWGYQSAVFPSAGRIKKFDSKKINDHSLLKWSWQIDYDNYNEECVEELAKDSCTPEINKRIKSKQLRPWSFNDSEFIDVRRVLLIVQFNDPHYVAASKNYALYARLFGDVVFCGPGDNDTGFWPVWQSIRRKHPLVSLPAKTSKFYAIGQPTILQGDNCYYCVNLAMEDPRIVNGTFTGVMMIADDVIPHFWTWNSSGKSLEKSWLMSPMSSLTAFDVDQGNFCFEKSSNNSADCVTKSKWGWTRSYYKQQLGFYNEAEKLAKKGDTYWKAVVKNMTRATHGPRRIVRGSAAILYVARQHIANILPIFKLMNKHRVFCEVAVPTAVMAVSANDDQLQWLDVKGYDWGNGFLRYHTLINVYKTSYHYLHPFKMGAVFRNKTGAFIADEKALFKGATRGNFNKKIDPSVECVYCYLRNLTMAYAQQFYPKGKIN